MLFITENGQLGKYYLDDVLKGNYKFNLEQICVLTGLVFFYTGYGHKLTYSSDLTNMCYVGLAAREERRAPKTH